MSLLSVHQVLRLTQSQSLLSLTNFSINNNLNKIMKTKYSFEEVCFPSLQEPIWHFIEYVEIYCLKFSIF